TRYAAAGALVALLIAPPGDVAAATPRPGIAFTRAAYGPAAQQPDFRWQGRLEPGETIEVRGVNGRIRAERATGDAGEVTAVKRARGSDPESVVSVAVPHEGRLPGRAADRRRRASAPHDRAPG